MLFITREVATVQFFMNVWAFQTIPQSTVRQPAGLSKTSTQKNSFSETAAFTAQHHSQPHPVQTKGPYIIRPNAVGMSHNK